MFGGAQTGLSQRNSGDSRPNDKRVHMTASLLRRNSTAIEILRPFRCIRIWTGAPPAAEPKARLTCLAGVQGIQAIR